MLYLINYTIVERFFPSNDFMVECNETRIVEAKNENEAKKKVEDYIEKMNKNSEYIRVSKSVKINWCNKSL